MARIIQIIPGTGWLHCVASRDEIPGDIDYSEAPVVAWGLTEDGEVHPLWADDFGCVDEILSGGGDFDETRVYPEAMSPEERCRLTVSALRAREDGDETEGEG